MASVRRSPRLMAPTENASFTPTLSVIVARDSEDDCANSRETRATRTRVITEANATSRDRTRAITVASATRHIREGIASYSMIHARTLEVISARTVVNVWWLEDRVKRANARQTSVELIVKLRSIRAIWLAAWMAASVCSRMACLSANALANDILELDVK